MTQQDFYNTPEVMAAIEVQKRNPYGSAAHIEAFNAINAAARKYGVWDEYVKAGGTEY